MRKNPRCFSFSVSVILSLPVCRTACCVPVRLLTNKLLCTKCAGKKKKITESETAWKWHFTCGFTHAVKIGFLSETSREARCRSEILFWKNVWRCDGFLQRSELNAPACSRSVRGEEQLFLWQCYHSLFHFINTIQVAVLLIFFTDRRGQEAGGGKIWGRYYRLWLLSLSACTLWDKKKKRYFNKLRNWRWMKNTSESFCGCYLTKGLRWDMEYEKNF